MKNAPKHLLSFCVLAVFALLAAASSVNHIHHGAFKYDNQVDPPTANCLVRNDGSRIYGKRIVCPSGVLAKNIRLDGQAFPKSDIKGYFQNGSYYGRFKNDYGRRIIHGKINVYVQLAEITSTNTYANGMHSTHSYEDAYHYAQMGEDGEMVPLTSKARISSMLEACPLAVELAQKKGKGGGPEYFNKAFDVYNNDCKE